MKQRTFESSHQQQWEILEDCLDNFDKRNLAQFPQLYRQVCQHLALAQDRHYSPHLVKRLNRLVLSGHQRLYQTQTRLTAKIIHFIRVDFPQRVRQESRLVGLSSLLFFGSLLLMFLSVQIKPELVYSLMDAEQVVEMEAMYQPNTVDRDAESDFLMFGFYIRNNISIGFQTFASGILFGVGTLFFLIFNGLYIGCVAGHLTQIGYSVPFYSFVAGHSALELIAIVLAGAAGLKLGLALIAPGRLSRLQALRQGAGQSIKIIYGVIIMLLLAAFLEAFWSSNAAIAPEIKYTIGVFLWITLIAYFVGHRRGTG